MFPSAKKLREISNDSITKETLDSDYVAPILSQAVGCAKQGHRVCSMKFPDAPKSEALAKSLERRLRGLGYACHIYRDFLKDLPFTVCISW